MHTRPARANGALSKPTRLPRVPGCLGDIGRHQLQAGEAVGVSVSVATLYSALPLSRSTPWSSGEGVRSGLSQ